MTRCGSAISAVKCWEQALCRLQVLKWMKMTMKTICRRSSSEVPRKKRKLLRCSLRRSDTVTRYSPNVAAFLLPTANYETGKQVMERIRGRFYRKCPSSDVRFDYRLTPLGGGSMLKDTM